MLDIPADANPARVYGTPEFERARMARIPMPPRRFVEDQREAPPFRNLREQHAHYMAVRARLNSGKIIEAPPVREEIIEPEPVVATPEFIPPAFWLGPLADAELPPGVDPDRDWLFISPRLRCATIIMATAGHFSLSVVDILSQRRTANVVRPRQIAMYLAKTLTLRSLPEIGRRFGGRDHTTVLHAVRKITRLIESGEAAVQADVAAIRVILGVKE